MRSLLTIMKRFSKALKMGIDKFEQSIFHNEISEKQTKFYDYLTKSCEIKTFD